MAVWVGEWSVEVEPARRFPVSKIPQEMLWGQFYHHFGDLLLHLKWYYIISFSIFLAFTDTAKDTNKRMGDCLQGIVIEEHYGTNKTHNKHKGDSHQIIFLCRVIYLVLYLRKECVLKYNLLNVIIKLLFK